MGRASGGRSESTSVVAPNNPAAGADWSFQVVTPGMLVAATATLTTDAVVNTRRVVLKIADVAGHVIGQIVSQAGQAANLVQTYTFSPNVTSSGAFAGSVPVQIPQLVLGAGWTLSTVTNLLDVGDQWSSIVLAFADL